MNLLVQSKQQMQEMAELKAALEAHQRLAEFDATAPVFHDAAIRSTIRAKVYEQAWDTAFRTITKQGGIS